MSGIDRLMLRSLCEARLHERLVRTGQLTVEGAAAVMVEVAAAAGLVSSRTPREPTDLAAPNTFATAIVNDTLRIGMRGDLRKLPEAIVSALEVAGFVYAAPPPTTMHLSGAQAEALWYAGNGYSYQETAAITGKGVRTVQTHLEKARDTVGARNTTHAAVIATRYRLMDKHEKRLHEQLLKAA